MDFERGPFFSNRNSLHPIVKLTLHHLTHCQDLIDQVGMSLFSTYIPSRPREPDFKENCAKQRKMYAQLWG